MDKPEHECQHLEKILLTAESVTAIKNDVHQILQLLNGKDGIVTSIELIKEGKIASHEKSINRLWKLVTGQSIAIVACLVKIALYP